MTTSSPRSTTKPKKSTSASAAAATPRQDKLIVSSPRAQDVAGKKVTKFKVFTETERQRRTETILTFAGTGVTAHDTVTKGLTGRALIRNWESTKGSLPTDAFLRAIGVSPRTAQRIKADPNKLLDTRTTDGIYRLESVRALAEEVLGSVDAATEWLNSEAMGLEFRKPIDLISTSPGLEAVKTLLHRMKFGVYA